MSEQNKDAERARVVDGMCMTWRHDFGLDRKEDGLGSCGMTETERDALRRRMGQLYDHHFAARSLPVGVPDGWKLVPVALTEKMYAKCHLATRVTAQVWSDLLAAAPAAPTVKESLSVAPPLPAAGSADLTAVRCQCCATEYPHDSCDAGFIAGSGMCQVCDAAMPPKDLPAAGSAVEEVEPIGYAWINRYNQAVDHVAPFPPTDGGVSYGERLMTVAQHERIVAALSAHQSAHVSVPRELVERIAGKGCDPDCCIAYWREQLRALLNGGEA